MDLLEVPAPVAPRLRRPGWRDPRLLSGLALVAGAVALGSWAVSSAQHTVPVYVARGALVPGAVVEPGDLAVADVRLTGTALERYLRADAPLPEGAVVVRVVGDGELVARSALGAAQDLDVRAVAVPLRGALPPDLVAGALVDLWLTPPEDGTPEALAQAVVVQEVADEGGGLSTGGATAHVLVPQDDLPSVLAALASDGRVDVVPLPGTGG
ncbi:hypothetical protein [Cellulomonas massiliensis]|uniref:hypothetical protein n=1 Tax=Cellulomonas massiliensis TaxID=1465811 RepID=UPI00030E46B9|nr:hypothetical protein [Cellulomonas massiliensis]